MSEEVQGAEEQNMPAPQRKKIAITISFEEGSKKVSVKSNFDTYRPLAEIYDGIQKMQENINGVRTLPFDGEEEEPEED